MFINYRKEAKLKMVIFGTLLFAGLVLSALGSGYVLTTTPDQGFAFWIMLGVASMGIMTTVLSFIGFAWAAIDYKELS